MKNRIEFMEISSANFRPSKDGVLVHFPVDDIDATLQLVLSNGGGIVRPRTKIEAEGMGYFALFTDSEGNTLGLYAGDYSSLKACKVC